MGKLTETQVAELNIQTEPFKKASGPGGSKVNKKASAGRAYCVLNGKKIIAETMKYRETENNQTLAKKELVVKIHKQLNKERAQMLSTYDKACREELLSFKNKPYKHP